MKTYTLADLKHALEQAGISQSEHTFIHSSLLSLGRLANTQPNDYCPALWQTLLTATSRNSTIYMPAFNYAYPRTRTAHLKTDKSEVGVWSDWFLQHCAMARSGHPMFSITAHGSQAQAICQSHTPEYNGFGNNATFARLHAKNALFLFIGTQLKVATFVVYCEALNKVGYRFLKPFKGDVTLWDDHKITGDFNHFCFPFNNAYRENYQMLIDETTANHALKKIPLGSSYIYAITANALASAVTRLLQQNPFALLNCQPTHYYHFVNGQELAYEINQP